MKNIHKCIVITFFLLVSLASCEQFEEINTNPNTPTNVSASMLCTEVVLSIAEFSGKDAKAMISANALPKYIGYAQEDQLGTQYNALGSSNFSGITVLPNIEKMVEYADGGIAEHSYKGVAKFARAFMFYELTMQMGDIPYSETNLGANGLYRPKYDTQESVLRNILDELKQADEYFAQGTPFTGDPTPFNGDPEKWRQATNAFALKVLLSLSEKEGNSSVNIKSRFQEIFNGGNLFDSRDDFFGLVYSSINRHPIYSTNDLFTKNTIVSAVVLNNLKSLDDRRMYYFAEPSGAQINGGKTASDSSAYVGVDVSMDFTSMTAEHSANTFSLINFRYLEEENSEPRRLLSYAEQQLILAEAHILGWISEGTAKEYYEEGVKAALTLMMQANPAYAHGMAIDQGYIDSYFTGEAAFKATAGEQLKQIWMQRYLLNFMQDPKTSYFEYRRTGYPDFPIDPSTSLNENNRDQLPLRWLYPSSETTYNREHLIEALDRQFDGYDEINKRMWLLK